MTEWLPDKCPTVAAPALLLRPEEAAEALSISPRKLWGLSDSGEIPCVRIGRSVRYDPRDLEAFIARTKGTNA